MLARMCLLVLVMQIPLLLEAQRKLLNLTGAANLGYSNSRVGSRSFARPLVETRYRDMTWGLGFALRTYILDPRFIALSFSPSLTRGSANTNSFETRNSGNGASFSLEFLRSSFYPFHFHFSRNTSDFEAQPFSAGETGQRSIGFDWRLGKPKLPPVSLRYDSQHVDSEFSSRRAFQSPAFQTDAKTFSLGTGGTLAGWNTNFNYTRQKAITLPLGLESGLDYLHAATTKAIARRSTLSVSSLYQTLHYGPEPGREPWDLPSFSVHTSLGTQHTEKLTSSFSQDYSRSTFRARGEASPPTSEPGRQPGAPSSSTSSSNSLGAGVTYRLLREITVGEFTEGRFLSNPSLAREWANRNVDAAGHINWHKQIRFLQTSAGYERGWSYARTTRGNSRGAWFDGHSAGVGFGDEKSLRVNVGYSDSRRPSLFEIGGRNSEWQVNGTADSGALRSFLLRAAVGRIQWDHLGAGGRERGHTATYSASLNHRIFSLQVFQSSIAGLRNLIESPLAFERDQIFRTLPEELLLSAPFWTISSVSTTALLLVKPRNDLDVQFQLQRQTVPLATAGFVVNEYELLATYRLGKFTFTGGVLYAMQDTQNLSATRRRNYFFRMHRPFRIF